MSEGRNEAQRAEARPHAVIVAGPNGAGKSTLAPKLLAQEFGIRIYVNPDVIAQGLAGFDPVSAGIRAGRTKEDLQKSVTLDRYRHFVGYPEQLPQMIGSAYDSLIRMEAASRRAGDGWGARNRAWSAAGRPWKRTL